MSELSIHEKIHNTLNIYDPQKITICVGSAALALQLKEFGWERSVDDVDVLASQEYINELNQRFVANHIDGRSWADPDFRYNHMTKTGERSISLVPKVDYSDELLKYQAFTTIRDDHHTATYSPDLLTVNIDGIQCLSAGEILEWKAKLMRQTDRETIQYALDNPAIRECLGDTASEFEYLMNKNIRQLEPTHGYGCGCYTCCDSQSYVQIYP